MGQAEEREREQSSVVTSSNNCQAGLGSLCMARSLTGVGGKHSPGLIEGNKGNLLTIKTWEDGLSAWLNPAFKQ